jgi:hypothetical protein
MDQPTTAATSPGRSADRLPRQRCLPGYRQHSSGAHRDRSGQCAGRYHPRLFQLAPVHIDPDGDYPTRDKARVVMENIRYKTPYFFSAEVFAAQPIIPVNLTKVRRQSDERFIEALNHIRANRDHREHVALFNRT